VSEQPIWQSQPETDASKVSVRAQQLASEHGVDTSNVRGTGYEGRITYADVERYVQRQSPEQ
jgi:pyruvate/2-oxoglutarate dehydrogenase complex dihydrolipoamide acyltransferase (E2) component